MATLQQQVQQHLQNTGISLRELSRRSGISHQAIGNILRDTDLECAKYRRVMQLEKELNDEKRNFAALEQVHEHVANQLKSAQGNAESRDKYAQDLARALAESKKEYDVMAASWKAACVQVEQLQKQLDHGQAAHSKLYNQLGATRAKYETQLEVANQKEVQLQEQLTEVYAEKTRQEAQIMRLRVYVWSLICAIVLLIVSGLVVWGGV